MKIFISLILIIISTNIFAQTTLSGYVTDKQSGERLIGATVINNSTHTGAVSNSFGFFSLHLPSGQSNTTISISFVGYKKYNFNLNYKKDTLVYIALEPGNEINEVVVTNKKRIDQSSEIGVSRISAQTIKRLPEIGGEADVFKVLQLLPGVSQGNEMSAGLYVRGGSPDQNLVLMDDVPVYYVNHLGGFVSTFNADAINSIKIIKGGFPARYGSRLSSVVDIRLKDGNNQMFQGNGSIGLVSSKVAIQGPIIKSKASFIISYRRMYYDLLSVPITKLTCEGWVLGYNFYDCNAKFNYQINQNNRCYLSFYSGDDRFYMKDTPDSSDDTQKSKLTTRWGNNIASLRWNHTFSSKLFLNTTLAYTRYRYKNIDGFTDSDDSISTKLIKISSIRDWIAKLDMEYYPVNNMTVRVGVNGTMHHFIPTKTESQGTSEIQNQTVSKYNNSQYNATELGAYIEDELNFNNRFNGNFSARYTNYQIDGASFNSIEPRIAINIPFCQYYSLKGGYSLMHQNVHMLSLKGYVFPIDYWVPATSSLKPENSEQVNFGISHSSKNKIYEMSIEAYYKTMNHLIEFKQGVSSLSGVTNWQSKVVNEGTGISKGIEVMLKKKAGRYTGWIDYTLSKTTRQFDELNNGKTFPYKFDRRHAVNIVGLYKINDIIDLSATWVYKSGSPYTAAIGSYSSEDEDGGLYTALIYSSRNAYRMKDYHRLDLGINFKKENKWSGDRIWNISIYNVYNRLNPYYYYWKLEDADGNTIKPQLKAVSFFCFLPSFSYSLSF